MVSLLAATAVLLGVHVPSNVYDLQNEFDKDANPHLSWSFGYGKTPTSFDLYKDVRQVGDLYAARGQSDLRGWSRSESAFPYAARNFGKDTYYQRWRPGDVVLHPSADLYSIARWTNSGDAGIAHVYFTFRRVENVTDNTPLWYIVVNGAVADSGDLALGDEQRSVADVLKVNSGDYIAVVVGCKDHRSDGTDLNVRAVVKVTPR